MDYRAACKACFQYLPNVYAKNHVSHEQLAQGKRYEPPDDDYVFKPSDDDSFAHMTDYSQFAFGGERSSMRIDPSVRKIAQSGSASIMKAMQDERNDMTVEQTNKKKRRLSAKTLDAYISR